MTQPSGASATHVPLTVAVVSRNEADLLEVALASAQWADHRLVLDMQSTDETRAVAERHGATVIEVPLVPVVERVRQFALDASPTEWLFFLDPDETTSSAAGGQARAAITAHPESAGFRWPFADTFFGAPLENSRGGARKLLLMHTARVSFSATQPAHEEPQATSSIIDLSRDQASPIQHNTFRTVHQSVEKLTRYALTGNPLEARGIETSDLVLPRLLFRHVVRSGAWRDGTAGIHAACLSALHDYVAVLRRWEVAGAQHRAVRRRTSALLGAMNRTAESVVLARRALIRR